MEVAVRMSREINGVSLFTNIGCELAPLFEKLQSSCTFTTYISQLNALSGEKESPASNDASSEETSVVDTLSKREREVLELMVTGISNPAIADKLCRSLGTVKIHVHNIYRKLGVSNRINAINKYHSLRV